MKSIKKKQKTKIVITILLCIFILFCLSTIAYSAFSSTMNITGIAKSRVEADIRITDFSLHEIVNATSQYEEFSKDTISTSISFKENAYAIYKVEVTNYGSTDVGIYSIDGIPEGMTYELIDYKLKDKICNDSGKCNNYAVKTLYIKLSATNIDSSFTLKFNFKIFYNFTYTNFQNTYLNGVLENETIAIDLSKDAPKLVSIKSDSYIEYDYSENILIIYDVTSNLEIISWASFLASASKMTLSSTKIFPASAISKKLRQRRSVVLPLPEEPIIDNTWPFSSEKFIFFKTLINLSISFFLIITYYICVINMLYLLGLWHI